MAEDDAETDDGGTGSGIARGLSSLLTKEILIPAAMSAGAAFLAQKGPDLLKGLGSNVAQKGDDEAEELGKKAVEGAKGAMGGGGGGMLGKVAGAALGKVGGGGGSGGPKGKTRRLPIQRWTDVAVPVSVAYERWSEFEEFPKFMHRVLSVNKDDDTIRWEEKIWFSKRQWEGEITERRKNDRIAWKTTSGMQHAGVVSFHQLAPRLTRVMVDMDFVPTGMIEKMASGMRFVKRAVEADLARFKAYVELGEAKELEYKSGSAELRDDAQDEGGSGSDDASSRDDTASDAGGGQSEDDSGDRDDERREREERRRARRTTVGSTG